MADAKTNLSDIYEPAIWQQYMLEEIVQKSAFVQSGIAADDAELREAMAVGGNLIDMPYWDDLINDASNGSTVGDDTTDEIEAFGLTTSKDQARKHYRNVAWQVANIVKYVAGDDPVAVILKRYVNWWLKEEQKLLLYSLNGVFSDATVAAALENDISTTLAADVDEANYIDLDAVEDTRFLLGDAYSKFTGMAMHSVILKRLRKLQQIDYVHDADQNLEIPYYNGLRVIVDDDMTVDAASGDNAAKYYTYLFGQGAIGRAEGNMEDGEAFELDRKPMAGKGSGITNLVSRRRFIMHPRGIAYTGTPSGVSPSDAELQDGSNWTKVYNTKNIRIARLVTNG